MGYPARYSFALVKKKGEWQKVQFLNATILQPSRDPKPNLREHEPNFLYFCQRVEIFARSGYLLTARAMIAVNLTAYYYIDLNFRAVFNTWMARI